MAAGEAAGAVTLRCGAKSWRCDRLVGVCSHAATATRGIKKPGLALPEKPEAERESILRAMYRQLGWQLAEFATCRDIRWNARVS